MIARCLPFGLFVGFLVLGQLTGKLLAVENAAVVREWVTLLRGVVVAAALFLLWPAYVELRKPVGVSVSGWIEAVVVGLAVFLLWIWLDFDWARVSGRSVGFDPTDSSGAVQWQIALLRLFGLAIVVPIMEEIFWRSFLMRWITDPAFLTVEPRRIGVRAFVITTALFALEHDQWLAGAIAGVAFNFLYMRTGNLWVPILAHAVTNALLGIWIILTRNWHFW